MRTHRICSTGCYIIPPVPFKTPSPLLRGPLPVALTTTSCLIISVLLSLISHAGTFTFADKCKSRTFPDYPDRDIQHILGLISYISVKRLKGHVSEVVTQVIQLLLGKYSYWSYSEVHTFINFHKIIIFWHTSLWWHMPDFSKKFSSLSLIARSASL